MIGKLGKSVAKNALFMALDVAAPGTGTLLKQVDKVIRMAEFLGPGTTLGEAAVMVNLTDDAKECAKNMALDFLGSL